MKVGIKKEAVIHAALAAAFSAGFNSDWAKAQFADLKRTLDGGQIRPYVPYIVGGAVLYVIFRGVR